MFDFDKLVEALILGCRNRFEIAEHLDIPESFLEETIRYFQQKYGLYKVYKNLIIYFDPLGIFNFYSEEDIHEF